MILELSNTRRTQTIGDHINECLPSQVEIDQLTNEILLQMSDKDLDTTLSKKRIE